MPQSTLPTPALSAGASLLALERPKNSGTRYGVDRSQRNEPYIGLLNACVRGGVLDLTQVIEDDETRLPVPAAWSTITDPTRELLETMIELSPSCLAVETDRGPSFAVAVEAAIARLGRNIDPSRATDEDDTLAYWCAHIPASQCLVFDKFGDDPIAGLLKKLRTCSDFPQTEAALANHGFKLDPKLADGTPVSSVLHHANQWDRCIALGMNAFAVVPAKYSHQTDMPTWEYLAVNRPDNLLSSIHRWASETPSIDTAVLDRTEDLTTWHHIANKARNGSRDEVLEYLKEVPKWDTRVDDHGRNALQRLVAKQPPLLTSCLRTAKLRPMLQNVDANGQGLWYYALPALWSHNRSNDANTMLKELANILPPNRHSLDHREGAGMFTRWWANIEQGRLNTAGLPDSHSESILRATPIDLLWGGEPVQHFQAACAFLRSSLSPNPDVGPTLRALNYSVFCDDRRAMASEWELSDEWKGALMFGLLCSALKSSTSSGHGGRTVTVDDKTVRHLDAWLTAGATLPQVPGLPPPSQLLQELLSSWDRAKSSTSSSFAVVQAGKFLAKWNASELARSLSAGTENVRSSTPASPRL